MRRIFFHIALFLTCGLTAQDIHFSQHNASPINLNPALTGYFDGDYRMVMNNRNQWQSVTVPFRTFSASFDTKITGIKVPKSFFGAGLLLNTDIEGDSDFGTTQIRVPLSYHRYLKSDSTMAVSGGLAITYNMQSINYNDLYYGSQYNGSVYNPELPSYEFFNENSLSYFDFEFGACLSWQYNGMPFRSGLSLNHLNKPRISFDGLENLKLYRKFNFFTNMTYRVNENLSLFPGILYLQQGWFSEFMFGTDLKYRMDNISFKAIYFTAWFRYKDAAILGMGLDYHRIKFGLSYDINYSKLYVASMGRGGLELSMIYIFSKPKPYSLPVHQQCPVFM
ncbi:MAG: hypothetical protein A2W91_18055 [Bacteroidetes bacterium GWF2_38_335]|nr:MAG: hypothetical protein A2W91_18055 [Bacteroidetes bacterium GWF2_38_335]OFY80129.1 MAG: hypothetical protein A2281_12585 [Bacteroidetes bacterium RIFOXYA12_FULL_38_20]HBS88544.1 hypothetical protein [Bacteroidales bacterium]